MSGDGIHVEGDWTAEERRIPQKTAERKGVDWVADHAEQVINRAKLVGELETALVWGRSACLTLEPPVETAGSRH